MFPFSLSVYDTPCKSFEVAVVVATESLRICRLPQPLNCPSWISYIWKMALRLSMVYNNIQIKKKNKLKVEKGAIIMWQSLQWSNNYSCRLFELNRLQFNWPSVPLRVSNVLLQLGIHTFSISPQDQEVKNNTEINWQNGFSWISKAERASRQGKHQIWSFRAYSDLFSWKKKSAPKAKFWVKFVLFSSQVVIVSEQWWHHFKTMDRFILGWDGWGELGSSLSIKCWCLPLL